MKPLEIYIIRINYKGCKDLRPCMVVEPPEGNSVKVLPMSSQWDCFSRIEHLEIRKGEDASGFDAAGLDRDCFIDQEVHEVALSAVLLPSIGSFTGTLKDRIEEWIGPF